jgi:hypothetical protein
MLGFRSRAEGDVSVPVLWLCQEAKTVSSRGSTFSRFLHTCSRPYLYQPGSGPSLQL